MIKKLLFKKTIATSANEAGAQDTLWEEACGHCPFAWA